MSQPKTQAKRLLVLDKSYAHKKAGALSMLANRYTICVPSAFVFEIFTTTQEKRLHELNNFPEFRRVWLPGLLKREHDLGEPFEAGDFPRLNINTGVLDHSWSLAPNLEEAIAAYRATDLKRQIEFFLMVIKTRWVPGFSALEMQTVHASESEFLALWEKLREDVRIRAIAKQLEFKHADRLDSRWLYYRYFQTKVLQALILLRRYPSPKDLISEEKLEHDIHDIEYLTLALHAGALATAENSLKIRKASMALRFRALEPSALLIDD